MIQEGFFSRRSLMVGMMLAAAVPVLAVPEVADGGTYYDMGVDALWDMTVQIVMILGYYVSTMYLLCTLFAIYNIVVIITKLHLGEEGFAKSVIMLIGSVIFVVAATFILPALFGYNTGPDDWTSGEGVIRLW